LAAEHPLILERIASQAESGHELNRLWQGVIDNGDMERRFRVDSGLPTTERYLAVYPMCIDLIPVTGDHGNNPGLTMNYTRSVYARVEDHWWSKGPFSADMAKALTIIGIVRGVYADRGEKLNFNKDFKFDQVTVEAEYLAQNMDRVEPIAAELVRRGNYDVDFVESLLSVQKPLMEGAL
jgi:hypothetical protein